MTDFDSGSQPPRRDRLRFLALMSLTAGALLEQFISSARNNWLPAAVGAISVLLLLILWRARFQHTSSHNAQQKSVWLIGLLLSCLCCGFLYCGSHTQTSGTQLKALLKAHAEVLCTLHGTIVSEVEYRRSTEPPALTAGPQLARSSCLMQCEQLMTANGPVDVDGQVQLRVQGHLFHVSKADRVEITGRLQAFTLPLNPGEFNSVRWAAQNGLVAQLRCNTPDAVTVTKSRSWPLLSDGLSRIREGLKIVFRSHFDQQMVPLAMTLLLGDRSELSRAQRDDFANAGLIHLLAISGLHVGLVILFFRWLCQLLNTSRSTNFLVILLFVSLYAVLVQSRPPILRAWLMTTLWIISQWHYRTTTLLGLLSTSGLVLFVCAPGLVADVGTQLSFFGVLGISWGNRILRQQAESMLQLTEAVFFEGSRKRIINYVFWIIPLTLLVAPLSLLNFQYVSLVGLILQVPATFLVATCMISSAVGVVLQPLSSMISALAFMIANFSLQLTELLSQAGHYSWSRIETVESPGVLWIVLWYLLCLPVASGILTSQQPGGKLCLTAMSGLLLAGGVMQLPRTNHETLVTAHFCSVGHGEAIVVAIGEQIIVYDCGSVQGGSIAAQTLSDALHALHADAIDTLIVSHADIDHYNGVPALLNDWPVGRILVSNATLLSGDPGIDSLLKSAADCNVAIEVITQSVRWESDQQMQCDLWLNPKLEQMSDLSQLRLGDNDQSLVMKVSTPHGAILLTGDLEQEGQQLLLQSGMTVQTQVMLAPHHGSPRANKPEFWQTISPQIIVMSSEDSALAYQPVREHMDTLEQLVSTAEGAIKLHLTAQGNWRLEQFDPVLQQWAESSPPK